MLVGAKKEDKHNVHIATPQKSRHHFLSLVHKLKLL